MAETLPPDAWAQLRATVTRWAEVWEEMVARGCGERNQVRAVVCRDVLHVMDGIEAAGGHVKTVVE